MPAVSTRTTDENRGFPLVTIVKSLLIMYGITIVLLFLLSLIVTYSNISEAVVSGLVLLITIVSIMMSAAAVGKTIGKKGWIYGAITGLSYMLILYLIGCLVYNSFTFGFHLISLLLIGVLSGAFGGIVGVNTKRKR